ncbi:MAG: NAD(P)-dependent oxidoreductase [Patescibacteria group bacterium]
MKNILITGGSGFIGTNVIETLRRAKPDLTIYNYDSHASLKEGVVNIIGDAAHFNPQDLPSEVEGVIHLLALANEKYCSDLEYAQEINVGFTRRLLAWAHGHTHLKKFIFMSTILAYDQQATLPVSEDAKLYPYYTNYSFTKSLAEQYVRHYQMQYGLPALTFRLSNIYGPYQRAANSPFLIPSKIVQALEEGKIEIRSGKPKRDWIYSADAADAIVKSLDSAYIGTLNLGSGIGTSAEALMQLIAEHLHVPYTSLDQPTTGPNNFYCDITQIQKELGWSPSTNLKEGILQTIDYIKGELHST